MARLTTVRVFAPAKINLTLHVTGQRGDGYHLLDSLVAFADVGDELVLLRGGPASLKIEGPEASALPSDGNNLVARVAAVFKDVSPVQMVLTKSLPVASGIGGGSADAAAAFRGLVACMHDVEPDSALYDVALMSVGRELLALGADIPMCVSSAAARIGGIGEQITPLRNFPSLHAVLVNPRCGLSTPAVFKALASRENPSMPEKLPMFSEAEDLIVWLTGQRNDLEAAATSLEPAILAVQKELQANPRCRLVRMSGSGATCFGLYATAEDAHDAAEDLSWSHPHWWVRATQLGSQTKAAAPQLIRSTT